ncbi:hypothetical protein JVU11DRAFT_1567 [Chiua virens]|nr:hypothetical protein JVU11DRAFT_1567 [Chiua virens]
MSDDSPKDHHSATQAEPTPQEPVQEVSPSAPAPSRTELLSRARSFLTSPQGSPQARSISCSENCRHLYLHAHIPTPPPSNLPNLLIGVARIFTWLSGTSALILFIYYRYLLPRLTQSYQARLALRKHQSSLIVGLVASASTLKETQAESYKDLPRIVPVYEDPQYAQYHSIHDLLSHLGNPREESSQDVPDITLLRCALEELDQSETDGTSTEDLFHHLESKLPWLGHEEGATRQNDLWNRLNDCSLFVSSVPKPGAPGPLPLDHPSRLLWKYIPPPSRPTPPLLTSLANLRAALPRGKEAAPTTSSSLSKVPTMSARQRTLQALSDFTGYITTQTYALGLPSLRGPNSGGSSGNLAEDELRREIRALKGLVLNRRSFLTGAGASGFANVNEPSQTSHT